MQATASGMLSVYFYDTLAGSQPLEPTTIAARANPQVSFRLGFQGMMFRTCLVDTLRAAAGGDHRCAPRQPAGP